LVERLDPRGPGLVAQEAVDTFLGNSCQRPTQIFDFCARRMISTVPWPSAERRMISARQTCFCGALRLPTIVSGRWRSVAVSVNEIPGRMLQTRTRKSWRESPRRIQMSDAIH
jgi:hypothetical protein